MECIQMLKVLVRNFMLNIKPFDDIVLSNGSTHQDEARRQLFRFLPTWSRAPWHAECWPAWTARTR